jgi:trk system potassium uptake protein TrkA
MQVLIVGAGEVGFHIAEILSQEGHDVALIDKDPELARRASERLDALVIVGNGASKRTLREARVARADILIAVTDTDEVNMVACMAAKHVGVPLTMARIRNPDYLDEAASVSSEFTGIDIVIQPEAAVADEIARIAELPGALEAGTFAGEQVSMVEVSVDPGSPAVGRALIEIGLPRNVLLTAILRESGMAIPDGRTVLAPHDRVFVVGKREGVLRAASLLSLQMEPPRSAIILGCGQLGLGIARRLEERGLRLVIFEPDYERSVDAATILKKALVIHDEGLTEDVLLAEGVADTDLFITATGDDRINILASLQAKRLGAGRTIAVVERAEFSSVLEAVGVDVAISPRRLTASTILRFIRGSDVLSVAVLERAAGEALEFIVSAGSAIVDKPLKTVAFPPGSIVGVIVHDDEVHIAHGESVLRPGDRAVVFSVPAAVPEVERLFAH